MNRTAFHKLFKSTGPVVLPVIHVLDINRTLANLREVIGAGASSARRAAPTRLCGSASTFSP